MTARAVPLIVALISLAVTWGAAGGVDGAEQTTVAAPAPAHTATPAPLEETVIRIDTIAPENVIVREKGIETEPRKENVIRRDIRLYGPDTAKTREQQLQVLRMQQEILKSQRVLLTSLGAIAGHQALMDSRSARVESATRDATLGMKGGASEMQKLRGEAAATNAKVTDVNRTTMEMAEDVKKMAKNIEEIEDTLNNVEAMIGKLSENTEDSSSDLKKGMKRLEECTH